MVGHIVKSAEYLKVHAENQAVEMVNYNQQNQADEESTFSNARDVRLPFNKHDVKLWFSLLESKMQFAGLKKQWSKRQVLVQHISPEFHSQLQAVPSPSGRPGRHRCL